MRKEQEHIKRLFHEEFSKMVAVISRRYGLEHIETAEDIVSDTFLLASETWGAKGLPENPAAWLYTVAKQKTLHRFRRQKVFSDKVTPSWKEQQDTTAEVTPDFSLENIRDSQLQMLFAICTPTIASEAQIGLALRILCGFGIDEIAEAFLSNKETINKRLFRAKTKLRSEGVNMELPSESEISKRLDSVLHIIYLLFNEGYYSTTQNQVLRKDFCLEAMRLGILLTECDSTNTPKTNALLALMCFHASRFDARMSHDHAMILYDDQQETLWDSALIARGMHFLDRSTRGEELSSYHLEARIACWHCQKEDTREKWRDILQLYNQLLRVNYSPSAGLNRLFALYKVQGAEAVLSEAQELNMEGNRFYHLLLAELHRSSDKMKARMHYKKAYALARTDAERACILEKLNRN